MQPNILFFHNSWEDLTRNCGNSPLKVSHLKNGSGVISVTALKSYHTSYFETN